MTATDSFLVDSLHPRIEGNSVYRVFRASRGFVRRKPVGGFGAAMLLLIITVGVLSPWIAPEPLGTISPNEALQGPSSAHWLGTNSNGVDLLSQLIFGCQVTAMVGLGTVLVVAALSLCIGVLSGYFRGTFDVLVQRIVDIWMSFPGIFLILTLVSVLQTGTGNQGFFGLGRGPAVGPDPAAGPWFWNTFPRTTIVIVALSLVLSGGASRIVRSAVVSVSVMTFSEAATTVGASPARIILRHVIPNILPTVIVLATLQLGTAILAEATISFLGVGITNFPTWGQMLAGRTRDMAEAHPYLAIVPGLAIFLAVFSFNMLGDALRDVLDPRLRGSS